MNAPHDPFGRCPPRGDSDLTRDDRVRLIGKAAHVLRDAIRADLLLEPAAIIFLYSSLSAWLERGGNLERDYFKVTKAKSHRTPAVIWRQINEAHHDERHS